MPKVIRKTLFLFLLVFTPVYLTFFAPLTHAQTPTLGYFTRSPWPHPFIYPCNRNTGNDPEFHPLRPYPGNPCDPLIPRKDPEAPASTNPEKLFLTFKCAKSLNVSGYTTVKDVINICGMPELPANPLSVPLDGNGRSQDYLCAPGSTDVCFVKQIVWAVNVDLSSSELPFSGQTEIPQDDAMKVNSYISWYLNGTIYQSEQLPLNAQLPEEQKRITTYSGPLNRLYPKDFRDPLKYTMATAGVNSDYHNYLVACQKDIDYNYIRDALIAVLRSIFGNLFDVIHFVGIILSEGIQNLGRVGEALVRIAQLPGDRFNVAGARNILLDLGLDVLGNNLNVISELISLGRNVLSRIGNIAAALRLDLAESCLQSGERWRLNRVAGDFQPWVRKYVPWSTLEDTTGEFTISVIPGNQPTNIDGTILSIGLTINVPSDSRLYFPHLRAAVALSEMADALHKPILTPTPGLSRGDRQLVRQRVSLHQGIDDSTVIQREYSGGTLIRNTEVREGFPAPTPLYTPSDPLCDLPESRTNKADQLLGKEVNGTLTYYQLFRYAPREVIDCAGGCSRTGASICVTLPCQLETQQCTITDPTQCCTDELHGGYGGAEGNCPWITECSHADADFVCVPNGQCTGPHRETYNQYSCVRRDGSGGGDDCCGPQAAAEHECQASIINPGWFDCSGLSRDDCVLNTWCNWVTTYPGHTIVPNPVFCPAWPDTRLRSAARLNPFTKTPFVEKLYDLLVANPQSLLRRWLPKLPLTATSSWEIKIGRENTIPAATVARYTGSTDDLEGTQVTGGRGGPGGLYFPHLGSMADNILGLPTRENLNLQRMLRPKGFIGAISSAPQPGGINCNTNVPPQNAPCVNKDNYVDVARRWTSMPDGTHAEMCFDDVVARALAAGVDPGFALLIWLNESDASNYDWATPVEDFGQHVGQYNTPNDFNTQITGFMLNVAYIVNRCSSYFPTYGFASYAAIFLTGNSCIPGPADYAYANMLQEEWTWISSCPFPFPPM